MGKLFNMLATVTWYQVVFLIGIFFFLVGIIIFVSWLYPYGIKIFGLEFPDHFGKKSKRILNGSLLFLSLGLIILCSFIPVAQNGRQIPYIQLKLEQYLVSEETKDKITNDTILKLYEPKEYKK